MAKILKILQRLHIMLACEPCDPRWSAEEEEAKAAIFGLGHTSGQLRNHQGRARAGLLCCSECPDFLLSLDVQPELLGSARAGTGSVGVQLGP